LFSEYDCGCQHGGHCHKVTGECQCKDGYYGNKCESFDYCSFYEDQNKQSACGSGGKYYIVGFYVYGV